MADYGYIGRNPADSNTTIGRQIFTATSGQKTFVVTGQYDVGFIQVYLNGIKLLEGEDYTANDSSSIILDDPCETNDKVEVVVFKAFNVSNPGTVGTLKVTGNLDVAGSLGVVGFLTAAATALDNISITGLSTFGTQNGIGTVTMGKDSAAIFCDGNTRIVGVLTVGEQNTGVTVDGADASVGIGTSVPGAALEIVNTQSRNSFRVSDELNPDYSPFVIDQSGNTGIGTLAPQTLFHVRSDNVKILARFRNEDGDEERCEIEFQDEQTSGNFKVKVGSQGDNLTGQCGFQSSIILGDNLNSERVHISAKVDTSASARPDDGLGITGFGTFIDYNSRHEMNDARVRVAGGIAFRPISEDHRNGETNMPFIGYGYDGTGQGGNNLEIVTHSTDGAINFYTGSTSSGSPGASTNKQRVVLGPDGQIGIGVTLGDNPAPTTNESVVLGLGVSMCVDNANTDGYAPILINAGPGDKSGTSSRLISLGCTAAGASGAANNVRIGYALGAPTSSTNSVIIGSRAMCNTNGGTDNVIIGSEINENVTDNSTNGNVVIGHNLELPNSLDRSILIGSDMDTAANPPTDVTGSNITLSTGDMMMGYNNKFHIFSQDGGSTNLYYNNVNMFATTADGARTSGSLVVDHGMTIAGVSTFSGSVSFGTIAGSTDDLTLTSNDGGEEILLDQSESHILFKTNNTTRMRITGTTGTLRSGGGTFQFEDSAGNVDLTINGSGILKSGTTSTTFQDSAGNDDLQITGVGIIQSPGTTMSLRCNGATTRFQLNSNGAIINARSYSEALGSTRRDLFVRSNGRFGYNSSARKTKKNIVGLTSESIDWIYDLNPVEYNYRIQNDETGEWTEEAETELEYGLIAEEVEPINVELCDYDPTPDGGQELVTVHYKKLTAPMLRALQDLAGKVKVLETEVAYLRSELNI
jgi:hypothetical protein